MKNNHVTHSAAGSDPVKGEKKPNLTVLSPRNQKPVYHLWFLYFMIPTLVFQHDTNENKSLII